MTSLRLLSVMSLAFVVATAACRDDDKPPPIDASPIPATGGAGGRGGSGGAGGRGGGGGADASSAEAPGSGGSSSGGSGGGAAEAGVEVGPPVDGAAGPEVMVDAPTPIDQAVDQAPPPPDAPPTTVMVSQCSQIVCPELIDVATTCNGNDSACTDREVMTQPKTVTNYCHANGVKKYAETTYSGPEGKSYSTVMRVNRANGSHCYTLELSGHDDEDLQSWIFKSPGGDELARATWSQGQNRLTILCRGVSYVIGADVGCPGTDGQPEGQCTAGACD